MVRWGKDISRQKQRGLTRPVSPHSPHAHTGKSTWTKLSVFTLYSSCCWWACFSACPVAVAHPHSSSLCALWVCQTWGVCSGVQPQDQLVRKMSEFRAGSCKYPTSWAQCSVFYSQSSPPCTSFLVFNRSSASHQGFSHFSHISKFFQNSTEQKNVIFNECKISILSFFVLYKCTHALMSYVTYILGNWGEYCMKYACMKYIMNWCKFHKFPSFILVQFLPWGFPSRLTWLYLYNPFPLINTTYVQHDDITFIFLTSELFLPTNPGFLENSFWLSFVYYPTMISLPVGKQTAK